MNTNWEENLDPRTAKALAIARNVTGYELKQGPYTERQLKQFSADIRAAHRQAQGR